MTVSAFSPKNYHPSGDMLPEAIGFSFLSPSDVVVQHQADGENTLTLLALNTDYEILGNGVDGTASLRALAAWPAADLFHINRRTAALQPEQFPAHQALPSRSVERGLDRLAMVEQENRADIDDIFRMLGGAPVPTPAPSGVSGGGVQPVATRTGLKAMGTGTAMAFLMEEGREGLFRVVQGTKPGDLYEGLYIASDTAGFYWERLWDGIWGDPEWFGAVADDSTKDNAPNIQACIDLCQRARLKPKKYYIGNVLMAAGSICITLTGNSQELEGSGTTQETGTNNNNCTELLINSGLASGVLVGKPGNPGGGVPSWTEAARLANMTIRRVQTIQNPASGFANAPAGVIMQWANLCRVERVWTKENSFGFYSTATVACHYEGCRALRYGDGTAPGNDFFVGFFQNNDAPSGFNSGNASLYYTDCGAFSNESAGNTYTYCAGIQTYQGFTDTFVTRFETVNCGYGMDFNGRSTTAFDWHTEDLIITDCVLDGSRFAGIRVQTTGPNTAVQIKGCYIGETVATGPSTNGIMFFECHGICVVTGCQAICATGNPATGLLIENSSGITCEGNIWSNLQDPIRLVNVVGFCVRDDVNGSGQGVLTAGVQLTNCQDGRIECGVRSSSPSFTMAKGVVMHGTGNARVEVNASRIVGSTITGGSANKLIHNGSQITATGAFGTNCLAQGVFA